MTLDQALRHAQVLGLDRLDAQLLVLHVLGRAAHDRAWLLTHDTDSMPTPALATLEQTVQRRLSGEPLAYITGHKEFFGLDLHVDARVLVPRPDTETLVEWALELLPIASTHPETTDPNPPRVLDLGTGSGAIALALQHTRPDLHILAVDASPEALAVAQANAQRLQLAVQFSQGSWMDGVQGRFDLIVSNPPYIASADHHLAALIHEPLQALASGADGLDDIRSIICQADAHLVPGGWLLLEHGYDQAAKVRALLTAAGLQQVQSRKDLAGIERCSGGQSTQAEVFNKTNQ
ncbi:MAG: peptide chain release factor N(5)-glutamine methyltransferase [Rhodoferax sp.]